MPDDFVRRGRAVRDCSIDLVTTAGVMRHRVPNSGAGSRERFAVRRKDVLDLEAADAFERRQIITQRIRARMPRDVGRDAVQDVVARKEDLALRRVQTDMAWRMTGRTYNFERSDGRSDLFAISQQPVWRDVVEILAQKSEMLVHLRLHLRGNTAASVRSVEVGQSPAFVLE